MPQDSRDRDFSELPTRIDDGAETASTPAFDGGMSVRELSREWYPGMEIGNQYRVERELGRGGMGTIYLATDLQTRQAVVLKTLRQDVAREEAYARRFVREAEAWVRLGVHPHVIRAHTVIQHQYRTAVVAEYASGGSLHDRMRRGLPSLETSLRLAVQIGWGMAYAHDHGLVHRDLKPANILLADDEAAKVSDFGLVKSLLEPDEAAPGAPAGTRQTETTMLTLGAIGTPEYMPPEQWEGRSSPASDIYAFGVLLYELLCGRWPFDDGSGHGRAIDDVYRAHQQTEPRVLAVDHARLPPGPLRELVLQCLSKKAEARPPGFRAVAGALNAIRRELCQAEALPEPTPAVISAAEEREQAYTLIRLSCTTLSRGEHDATRGLLRQARDIFKAHDDGRGEALILEQEGMLALHEGDADRAARLLDQSNLRHGYDPRSESWVQFLIRKAMMLMRMGRLDKAAEPLHEAMRVARDCGLAGMIPTLRLNEATLAYWRGDEEAALRLVESSLPEIREQRLWDGLVTALNLLSIVYRKKGRMDLAIRHASEAVAIAGQIDHARLFCDACSALGNAFQEQGDYPRARQWYEKFMPVARRAGSRRHMALYRMNIAYLESRCQRYPEALDHFAQALADYRELRFTRYEISSLLGLAETRIRMGQAAESRADLDAAARLAAARASEFALKIQELEAAWQAAFAPPADRL